MLESVLLKAAVLQVKDMKMAKGVWKLKADLVVRSLRSVCSLWCTLLTTEIFRKELHRILDDTAQTIRSEVLIEVGVHTNIRAVATLAGDVYLLRQLSLDSFVLDIFDRRDLMTLKTFFHLPPVYAARITGCERTKSLYIEAVNEDGQPFLMCMTKSQADGSFTLKPMLTDMLRYVDVICVRPNGGFVTLTHSSGAAPAVIRVFRQNRSLEQELRFGMNWNLSGCDQVMEKRNRNLILVIRGHGRCTTNVLEVSTTVCFTRSYQSRFLGLSIVRFADDSDRVLVTERLKGFELLDSELNLIAIIRLPQDLGKSGWLIDLYFDQERNEMWRIHFDDILLSTDLTVFRLTDE